MIVFQSNEVKTRFAEILRKVQVGQEIGITRHGVMIARLLPYEEQKKEPSQRSKAIQRIKAFRKHSLLENESIAEMRAEGRH